MSSIRVSFFLFTLKKPFLYFFSRKNFRGLKIQIFNLDDYTSFSKGIEQKQSGGD